MTTTPRQTSAPLRPEETRSPPPHSAAPSSLAVLTALWVGIAGLVVGTGIGLRWLRAGAIGWATVLGLVALVAGVLLVGWGLARIGRSLPTWALVALRTFLALLVALVVWTLTPAVIATNVPPIAHGTGPGDFDIDARDVRFTAEDGAELFGWYVPPIEGKVAVLRHGAGSTASAVLPQARVLLDNGYGVLLTDARGHGSSSGTGMDFGWHGDADIAAAIDFLTTQPEVDPDRIVVLGLSMGGEEAIGAMAADGRIAAVVAEGASARTEADKAWLSDDYGGRGWVQIRLEWVQYALTDLLTAASKPVSLADAAAVASPKPILMITAGNVSDEANAARHVQAAAGGNVSVWAVPGADHIGGLGVAPEEWEETVITFLDSAIDGQT
jgi:pimeloyl-ACP methyl ester carboxylesterase